METGKQEQREKEKHQLNLILHNVPKFKSSEPNIRKKEDADFAQSIFLNILGTPVTVTNAVRLGKKVVTDFLKLLLNHWTRRKLFFETKLS